MLPDEEPISFAVVCDMLLHVPASAAVKEKFGKAIIVRSMIKHGYLPSHDGGTIFYASEINDYNAVQRDWREKHNWPKRG